jgi:Zn-dependent protease with chaperone function
LKRPAFRLERPSTPILLVAAAFWLGAAYALWHTTASVPQGPDLSPHRFFSDAFLQRSSSYERFLVIDGLLASVTLLVVLALYARRGHRLTRESAAGPVGTGMLLGMLGFAVVWLAELPFGLAGVWWQRDHGVSHQGYLEWAVPSFLGLGATFLFVAAALAIAMGLAGPLRRWWWVAAVPAFVGLALLFALVSPYLVPETSPLRDPHLGEARGLERREGVEGTRFAVEDVDRFTAAPNAEATGLGPTRTVILWNTLLNGDFSRAEVRAVLGHEIAHLAHDDPLKQVGWLALFLIPAAALIELFTRRRGGMARPEAVPIALLVLVVLQVLTTPMINLVTRRAEASADWSSLEATHEPAVARAMFRRLSTTSQSSPDPPAWTALLYGSHPTIMQRIEMTYAWEEAHRP